MQKRDQEKEELMCGFILRHHHTNTGQLLLALESYSPTNERRRGLWPLLFVGQDAGFQAFSQHCHQCCNPGYAVRPVTQVTLQDLCMFIIMVLIS